MNVTYGLLCILRKKKLSDKGSWNQIIFSFWEVNRITTSVYGMISRTFAGRQWLYCAILQPLLLDNVSSNKRNEQWNMCLSLFHTTPMRSAQWCSTGHRGGLSYEELVSRRLLNESRKASWGRWPFEYCLRASWWHSFIEIYLVAWEPSQYFPHKSCTPAFLCCCHKNRTMNREESCHKNRVMRKAGKARIRQVLQ